MPTYRGTRGRLSRDQKIGKTGDYDTQLVREHDGYIYTLDATAGVDAHTLDDPTTSVGNAALNLSFIGNESPVSFNNDILVAVYQTSVHAFDISDPTSITSLYDIDLSTLTVVGDITSAIAVDANTLVVNDSDGTGTIRVFDTTNTGSISEAGTNTSYDQLDNSNFPIFNYQPGFFTDDVVAIVGADSGSGYSAIFYDVSDPANPVAVDFAQTNISGRCLGVDFADNGRIMVRAAVDTNNVVHLEKYEARETESFFVYRLVDVVNTNSTVDVSSDSNFGVHVSNGRVAFPSVDGYTIGRLDPLLENGKFGDAPGGRGIGNVYPLTVTEDKGYLWVAFGADPGLQIFDIIDA